MVEDGQNLGFFCPHPVCTAARHRQVWKAHASLVDHYNTPQGDTALEGGNPNKLSRCFWYVPQGTHGKQAYGLPDKQATFEEVHGIDPHLVHRSKKRKARTCCMPCAAWRYAGEYRYV